MRNKTIVTGVLSVFILSVSLLAQVTPVQRAEIEKTLTEANNEVLASINQLNTDALAKYLSEDFQERVGGGNVGVEGKTAHLKWLANLFSQRVSQKFEQDFIKVYVISPDLAYVVTAGGGPVIYKSGRHAGFASAMTSLWRKEPAGWRIIHQHESWW